MIILKTARKICNTLGFSNDKQYQRVIPIHCPLHGGVLRKDKLCYGKNPAIAPLRVIIGRRSGGNWVCCRCFYYNRYLFQITSRYTFRYLWQIQDAVSQRPGFCMYPFCLLSGNKLLAARFSQIFPRIGHIDLWTCCHGNNRRYCRREKRGKAFDIFIYYHYRKSHWCTTRRIYPQISVRQRK
ncbi:hypothetical protein KSU1_B0519 [Candidatus Jettenia caeni]|uniref:Uncharacterized protein n=1 Tax=Candidatus Jettenia caeni TaxID=247490 RepID=I3II31_9BACT|nr:hypothetical protein KSU1_B0519 [Candidatus Jettenia caeni]